MNRDDIATGYIGQLQQAQMDGKDGPATWHASLASGQALKARDNYVLQMQRRTAEAMQLINQSKQQSCGSNWRRQWPASSLAMMPRRSMKCVTRLIGAPLLRKPGCNSARPRLTPIMQEIEHEAPICKLQDKLPAYKQEMACYRAPLGRRRHCQPRGEGATAQRSDESNNNN
jgi:hypothetical protein